MSAGALSKDKFLLIGNDADNKAIMEFLGDGATTMSIAGFDTKTVGPIQVTAKGGIARDPSAVLARSMGDSDSLIMPISAGMTAEELAACIGRIPLVHRSKTFFLPYGMPELAEDLTTLIERTCGDGAAERILRAVPEPSKRNIETAVMQAYRKQHPLTEARIAALIDHSADGGGGSRRASSGSIQSGTSRERRGSQGSVSAFLERMLGAVGIRTGSPAARTDRRGPTPPGDE